MFAAGSDSLQDVAGNEVAVRSGRDAREDAATSTARRLPGRKLTWVVRGLCLVAAATSGYLAWTSLQMTDIYGCGGGEVFDCSHVLSSRWASVFGLPVSVPAFALYASLLAVLTFMTANAASAFKRVGWAAVTFGGVAAGLAAVWFIGLQIFAVEHFCTYCLLTHACGLALAAIVLYRRPLGTWNTSKLSGISLASVAVLVSAQAMTEPAPTYYVETYDTPANETAAAATDEVSDAAPQPAGDVFAPPAGVFEAPDVVFEPPAGAVDSQPADSADPQSQKSAALVPETENESAAEQADGPPQTLGTDPSVASTLLLLLPGSSLSTHLIYQAGQSDESDGAAQEAADASAPADDPEAADSEAADTPEPAAEPPAPIVSVANGQIRLDCRHWPLLGNPRAKYVFVEMFDYTCPHCRNTHRAVKGAFDRLGSDLGMVALPVPLNRACNSAASGGGQHQHACEIARLAVAVWRTSPRQFHEYHDWLFESSANTQPTVARRKAEQLVGADALRDELSKPYADQYIAKHVELYKRVGAGTVPKLMFTGATVTGALTSTSDLVRRIESQPQSR